MSTERNFTIKYLIALILFGSNGVISSYINLSSFKIVFLRTFLGSLLLFILFFIGKNKLTFHKYPTDFLYVALAGIVNGLSWIFLFEAYARIGVSISALLYSCGPIIIMAVSLLVYREKLKKVVALGFTSILLGVYLVNGGINSISHSFFGIICGVLSAVMYAFMVMFNKKSKNIGGLESSMFQLFFSFLTVLAILIIRQDLTIEITTQNIIPILVLGLVNTGIGCYLYFSSITFLPVQTVAICGYLEPLSAVILSVMVLNESMTILQLIGIVLLLGGLVVCQTNQNKEVQR